MTNKKKSDQFKWDLDQPWCIGSEDYKTLMNHVNGENIYKIVELGSGQSTFQLAEDFPSSILFSLENDSEIRFKNSQILRSKKKLSANIILSPLRLQLWKGLLFFSYNFSPLSDALLSDKINLLVIDGPVERLVPMGREASLYFLFDKLAIGSIVGLDDYHRASAKKAVYNWLNIFDKSLILEEETSTFAVLRKVSECPSPKIPLALRFQALTALSKSLVNLGKSSISKNLLNVHISL